MARGQITGLAIGVHYIIRVSIMDTNKSMNVSTTAPISPSKMSQLVAYPTMIGLNSIQRWNLLCDGLLAYKAPPKSLTLSPRRKWELVSALQKSIRRGDCDSALTALSAMDGIPHEYPYFWRRLCVIACEDIGFADDELATFVIACSVIFTPIKTGAANYGLFCFLTEQMCALARRSRIYCSLAVVDDMSRDFGLPALTASDRLILAAVAHRKTEIRESKHPWRDWQRKNGWRTEGLLQYLDFTLPFKTSLVTAPLPISKPICSLPNYCYDMHTRVGLTVLKRIAAGVEGAEAVGLLLRRHRVKTPHIAIGWALFFVEGGRTGGEVKYEEVSDLEQRVIAHRFGLPVDVWRELRALVSGVVDCGVVDQQRSRVSNDAYESPIPQSGNLFDIELAGSEVQK